MGGETRLTRQGAILREPATRVVRTRRVEHATPVARVPRGQQATRVVRVPRHAWKNERRSRSGFRRVRQLCLLLAFAAVGWWAFGQVSGLGGATATEPPRQLGGGAGLSTPGRSLAATRTPAEGRAGAGSPTPAATAARGATPALATTSRDIVPATPTGRPAVTMLTPAASPLLKPLPVSQLLQNDYQVFETWNDCGPASLSMALSYFGIHQSQATLAQELRPYQNDQGNNDDKDVTMDELAAEARKFGLLAYHRPAGTMGIMKRFIANGMPVIAETVLTKDDDIGHFRVVKGYDDTTVSLTQDDSMQGHNVTFTDSDFNVMWKKYNYEYLVLVPRDKQRVAEAILGQDLNPRTAWARAASIDRASLATNPADIDSRFNLSVALYYVGDYLGSVREFERVQSSLPFRMLWYQIEPIEAYYRLGDYQKVFTLSDTILNGGNRAFSQLYIIRGMIDKKQGNLAAARAEFENAVFYNTNLKAARTALSSLTR
jgi:Peptidase_C39 like family